MIFNLIRCAVMILCAVAMSLEGVSYTVRDYEAADFSRIIALCKELPQKENENDLICYKLAVKLHDISSQKEPVRDFAKVVQVNGNIVAFGLYEAPLVYEYIDNLIQALHHDGDPAEASDIEKAAKVSSLMLFFLVDSAYEGKGYSLLLLNDIKKELQDRGGFSTLFTFVNNDDHARIDLYKKQGFTVIEQGDSQTELEEALRLYGEHNALYVMKFPLVQVPAKKGIPLSNVAQGIVHSAWSLEKAYEAFDRFKIAMLKDLLKSFATVSPPLKTSQLLAVLMYYMLPTVTRDDAYKFAARLLNRKVLSSQVKKYIMRAMDFVEATEPRFMAIKENRPVKLTQYQTVPWPTDLKEIALHPSL